MMNGARIRIMDIDRPSNFFVPGPDDIDISREPVGACFISLPALTGRSWQNRFAVHLGDTRIVFTHADGRVSTSTCKYLLGSSWKRV